MLEVDVARERIVIVGGFDPSVQIAGTWERHRDGRDQTLELVFSEHAECAP